MDKKQFAMIAMALKTYYPRENIIPNDYAMDLWFEQLQDIPFEVAELALKKWVATNKWSPSISEIRKTSKEIMGDEIDDWGLAWKDAINAIKRYGMYQEKEALESLNPITRQCVERMGYKELCISENIIADRAHFERIYNNFVEREVKRVQIPEKLQSIIDKTTSMMIEGG